MWVGPDAELCVLTCLVEVFLQGHSAEYDWTTSRWAIGFPCTLNLTDIFSVASFQQQIGPVESSRVRPSKRVVEGPLPFP